MGGLEDSSLDFAEVPGRRKLTGGSKMEGDVLLKKIGQHHYQRYNLIGSHVGRAFRIAKQRGVDRLEMFWL